MLIPTRNPSDLDMRLAAAGTLARLSQIYRDAVPWSEIAKGFPFLGGRIMFASQALGIFKPRQMDRVLSIKTVVPREGRGAQYSDQVADGSENGMWVYDMRERNPAHPQNHWLKTAWTEGLPLIYLRGLAPSVYLPSFPVYVTDWDAGAGQVRVALGLECTSQQDLVEPALMGRELSRYTYGRMQNRVSVARFRVDVLEAYQDTCALSGLAQPQLVDAVPIAPGGSGGRLDVTEGLCMSRLHHAAFDANLLGIDPDGRVHFSEQLGASASRNSFVRHLMVVAGRRIAMPRAPEFQPNRDLLAARFEQFQAS